MKLKICALFFLCVFFSCSHAESDLGPYSKSLEFKKESNSQDVESRWDMASSYYVSGELKSAYSVLEGMKPDNDDRAYLKAWLNYNLGHINESTIALNDCSSLFCNRLKLAIFLKQNDISGAKEFAENVFGHQKTANNYLILLSVYILSGSLESFDRLSLSEGYLALSLDDHEKKIYIALKKLRLSF